MSEKDVKNEKVEETVEEPETNDEVHEGNMVGLLPKMPSKLDMAKMYLKVAWKPLALGFVAGVATGVLTSIKTQIDDSEEQSENQEGTDEINNG